MKKEKLLNCGHRINKGHRIKLQKLAAAWGMTLAEAHRKIIDNA